MVVQGAEPFVRKVLFFTHAESGQANTILALALELLTRPHVQVHIASFPSLSRRVHGLNQAIKFHSLDGSDMLHALPAQGLTEESVKHPPVTKSWRLYDHLLVPALTVWDGEEYMRIYKSCKKVIEEIQPDLVVLDAIFNPGLDACFTLNQRFLLNTPNTPLDVVRVLQPWLKGFWYYPALASAIPFPVPWSLLLLNIWISIRLIYVVITSTQLNNLIKYRNEHGLPGRLPMDTALSRTLHMISPGIRELDYPLFIPDTIGLYGPMVLDTTPIEVADPELTQWLDRGETVMMCMGTHYLYTVSQIRAVVNGFLGAVGHNYGVQFFWKLSGMDRFEGLIEELLANPKDRERFRIVDWIHADPSAVMNHPNVVVSIHHGGANSYYEAARAGVPQIILAQWFDLYDMAT
ncbi:UDP-Glycosyltransferase/glycogen phosphorylase [Thelephora ganbajun]|uniref:UDP-Glycosyltransferase/glycogen phosphorylase n=1 Tax=Thelephora ganbajun TaxID=370292 RepID=A0ACB6Z7Y1_THEGA|nr:UDP-Glycosyltransferase/glycogen phosphorylase [Thelephora ganbajun]